MLIIDEVDAFPFVDNKMLYYAVDHCLKSDGVKVFLTATSTDQLDKQVKQGKLKKLHLARRFHANPLVVPKPIWLNLSLERLQRDKLPHSFLQQIRIQRGVTFPCVDVFVMMSNHYLFTKSSLVQIAGRVGRSADRPDGKLLFFHNGMNRAMKKAIMEIKTMNKKGGFA